ncbi:PAS domain S-box-containing protein/diguanylate cyclase (GGDEF) domain-containing protein [Atopomonas hussainii]|uniref:cyclic-guanylate-specific phosphodiesterase n=1 Tax=Atopomonas hussainii TaxID=1429083 RepID=A0A1H7IPE1_9GAMM|nr:PAS domain S-box-containing protein/diguanylate cyclase (GGDEF) domain-containing protein [Atopomonas hussainii]
MRGYVPALSHWLIVFRSRQAHPLSDAIGLCQQVTILSNDPTLSSLGSAREASLRRPSRLYLVTLLLAAVALLIGHVITQYRDISENFRQHSSEQAEAIAQSLSQRLKLRAEVAQQVLLDTPRLEAAQRLRSLLPAFRELADPLALALRNSLPPLEPGQRYYFRQAQDGQHLWLQLQDVGSRRQWLILLDASSLLEQLPRPNQEDNWLLADAEGDDALLRPGLPVQLPAQPLNAQETGQRLSAHAVAGSDWLVISLLDEQQLSQRLLRNLLAQTLLIGALTGLCLWLLWSLFREQHSLQHLNREARRSLRQAGELLDALDERVLATDLEGRVLYLNLPAQRLLRQQTANRDLHLSQCLPELLPLLKQKSFAFDMGAEHVRLIEQGESRLFNVVRNPLQANLDEGYVWLLRDVTDEQQAMRGLQETRRRYQEIFEGVGTSLIVLDLSKVRSFLIEQRVHDTQSLERWLKHNPTLHDKLLRLIRITEINQVTSRLLGARSPQEAWRLLFDHGPLRPSSVRTQIIAASIGLQQHLDTEVTLHTHQGHKRHLWLTMRLPDMVQDLSAVTASFNDITARKRIETSLIEREKFWSDVVKAVPDTLYIHDFNEHRAIFTNRGLGFDLGYSHAELKAMGAQYWEKILHPDDYEFYEKIRRSQRVIGDHQTITGLLRWRHHNGDYLWFQIRERAFSRKPDGTVHRLIGTAKNVTDLIEATERMRTDEARYRALTESLQEVIWTTDSEFRLDYVSPMSEQLLGIAPQHFLNRGYMQFIADRRQLTPANVALQTLRNDLLNVNRQQQLRDNQASYQISLDFLHAAGHKVPLDITVSLQWDANGRFKGLLGLARDVTEQRRAERELRMAATVFDHSTAAVLVTDPAGYVVKVNHTFTQMLGYSNDEIVGKRPNWLTADRQEEASLPDIQKYVLQAGSWEGEIWLKRQNGEVFPAWIGLNSVDDSEGDLVSFVCFCVDISERKASEQRIHRLAYYDALTSLPNRSLFQDRLHAALQHAGRHNEWVALMFLDLDRFKPINDSLGHAAGDRMLKEVAERLSHCSDLEYTLARMGGDEFTLLVSGLPQREEALNQAMHLAESILAQLAKPFRLERRDFFVTGSIGIALFPQDGVEANQLMKNADTAMYHAKEVGRNNFQFYQAEMNARALERLELESDLRRAVEQQEFELFYQAQFARDGQQLIGAEALLRWRHPQRGLISPALFIPVLEELGLIVPVGDWALREACQQLMRWDANGLVMSKVSVNLSARQFDDASLGSRVASVLAETRLNAKRLELELTESILMHNIEAVLPLIESFKRLGLTLAIDDFGTGYSSLSYLKQLPIDLLKIDRSFVDGLPDGEQDGQIARAIIAMAHSLNMQVIAEGVETAEQLAFLQEHGCDEFQGYLLAKPLPAGEFLQRFRALAATGAE